MLHSFSRYSPSTGIFTVPSGGAGTYYFSTYLLVQEDEYAYFNIVVNGIILCTAWGENDYNDNDRPQAACSGLVQLNEGMKMF